MSPPTSFPPEFPAGRLLFTDFELRLDTWELSRAGRPIKLQRQPARLLGLLALRSGQAVSREEIRRYLWGEETFLDVDLALNFAVRQIRRALGDSFAEPRFVATLPRFGYRFLPPVRRIEDGAPSPDGGPSRRRWRFRTAGLALLALLALLAPLGSDGSRRNGRRPAISPAAREAYLEGTYLSRRPGRRAEAVADLERAVALAPGFAPAWSALAHARLDYALPAAKFADGVESAARQALRLDPGNAEAHRALGELALFVLFDLARAKSEIRLALRDAPGSAEAHLAYAKYLAAVGPLDAAIAEAERARWLDPANLAVKADLVWFHYLARDYDEAIRLGRREARLDPLHSPGRFYLVLAEMLKMGSGDPATLRDAQAFAVWLTGRLKVPPPARFTRLHDFWSWYETMPFLPADLALGVLAEGDRERALGLFEAACRRHQSWALPFLAADPLADPLRGDPRFARLLRCAGHSGLET
jgi:DNA-binding winged helix-turn-helix (wHTH) protein/tetratricopeptide (TPR) repeat protein